MRPTIGPRSLVRVEVEMKQPLFGGLGRICIRCKTYRRTIPTGHSPVVPPDLLSAVAGRPRITSGLFGFAETFAVGALTFWRRSRSMFRKCLWQLGGLAIALSSA